MKTYQGVKVVQAEPLNEAEAIKQGWARPNLDAHEMREGYKVVYEGGYTSWSPKDVFEKAYDCIEKYDDRLKIEYRELINKVDKLSIFLKSTTFRELVKEKPQEACKLELQYKIMQEYLVALLSRIVGTPYVTFSMALQALELGYAVKRDGWVDDKVFVVKQVNNRVSCEIIKNMISLPERAKAKIMEIEQGIEYTNQCLIINEDTGKANSWTPSVDDMFSEDWIVVIK